MSPKPTAIHDEEAVVKDNGDKATTTDDTTAPKPSTTDPANSTQGRPSDLDATQLLSTL